MPDVARPLVVALHHFDPAAETDGVIVFGPLEFPRIAVGEPVLRGFLLPAAADDLAEQAVIVTDAVAMCGDFQRRHAVHEAGGEAPEAAVAERGVGLDAAQLGQIDAELLERLGHRLHDPEIGHGVEQQSADQEFQREVVDALAPVGVGRGGELEPSFDDDVAGGEGDGEKPVARARDLRNLADGIGQLGQHRGLEFSRRVELLRNRLRLLPEGRAQIVHVFSPVRVVRPTRSPPRARFD